MKNFRSDWLSLRPRAKMKQKRRQGESGYPITPSFQKNCLQSLHLVHRHRHRNKLFILIFTLFYFILFFFKFLPSSHPPGKGKKERIRSTDFPFLLYFHSFLNHLDLSFIFNLIQERGTTHRGLPQSVLHLFTPRVILIIPKY